MSLSSLYKLRIIQLDVYVGILQIGINSCDSYLTIKKLRQQQHEYFEERKQIRKFLNMTELWRLQNA